MIVERSFEYSAFPGMLGAPVGGGVAILILAGVSAAGASGRPGVALATLATGGILLGLAGRWIGGQGVLALPIMRRRAVNLEAAPRGLTPRIWLVAHIDSKWQPVPMLIRACGVVLLVVCALVAIAFAGFGLFAPPAEPGGVGGFGGPSAWRWFALVSGVSGLPVLLSFVGARNVGAIDNASGVATVLAAAELLDPAISVGVLITDAEELALAGARAWCVGREPGGLALNCDSVDDDGMLTVMTVRRGDAQAAAVAAFRSAARGEREGVRVIPLIPGVLTDSVAFAAAGWASVTLSRGTLRTLGTIHTVRDRLENLTGAGIDRAARVLAHAAAELAEARPG